MTSISVLRSFFVIDHSSYTFQNLEDNINTYIVVFDVGIAGTTEISTIIGCFLQRQTKNTIRGSQCGYVC
jgi:hypothetical protein